MATSTNTNNGSNINGAAPAGPSFASNTRDKESLWYFTAEQLANSPSRRHGIDADQELSYRQLTAYLIQEMGQRLQVSQLCINTAIVYMHRFYAFHSFHNFHRNGVAAASLFLAAKVEEQPRKLEHVIKVAHICLNQETPHPSSEVYAEEAQDLAFNENVLLQTLGFDVAIDHPHTHVVKTCHLVKGSHDACKDLAQTSYFLASNSLHLTSMCLQYRPTVVACFCIYLACKWSRWEIPQSTEGKHWFHYVDKEVTMDLLKQLTDEFIAIYEKSPARLKSKLNSIKDLAQRARSSESNGGSTSGSATALQLDQQQQMQLQQQQQQSRRTDPSYSSHHRTHHSSSHHHHSKQIIPPNELGEHKPSTGGHKQPYPTPNRPRPNDPTQQYPPPSGHSSKQMQPPSSRPTGSNSNRPTTTSANSHNLPTTSSSQRPPHAHDPNYHKNRSNIPAQLNPPPQGHKMLPKTDPNSSRSSGLKDANGRPIDPNKMQSSKHFSNSTSSNSAAANVGVDMTRSMLQGSSQQQQRPYVPQSSANNSLHQIPPPSYNQSVTQRNTSVNNKYEQQSVQQHVLQQQNQKQASLESSFSSTQLQSQPLNNSRQIDDSYPKSQQNDQMELCSPPKYSQYAQQAQTYNMQQPQANQQQQQHSQQQTGSFKSSSSIFSPEWSDKSSANNISGQPYDNTHLQGHTSSNDKRQGITTMPPKKPDNQVPNYPLKRPLHNEGSVKSEDDLQRDVKLRKVDAMPYSMYEANMAAGGVSVSQDVKQMKNYPVTVNGIETNPDLVSSLLKESLCTDNKFPNAGFIKPEPTQTQVHTDPNNSTSVQSVTAMDTIPQQILQNPPHAIKEEQVISAPKSNEEYSKVKSEKKKKKDKHKHKEKDKSKDKDEKKKHKKDKDKHKERDRASETESEPVKIKISMDKLSLPQTGLDSSGAHPPVPGFKIKIPKDRLTGYQDDGGSTGSSNAAPPPALKIKISKDKIENYSQNTDGTDITSGGNGGYSGLVNTTGNNYYPSYNNSGITTVNSSSSSSSKKKDRDREKEKKRSSGDFNKQNGNSGSSGITGSSSKNQSTNKIQQFHNNMSQLFGESNDDDDDEDEIVRQQISNKPTSMSNHHSSSYSRTSENSSSNRYNKNSSGSNQNYQQIGSIFK